MEEVYFNDRNFIGESFESDSFDDTKLKLKRIRVLFIITFVLLVLFGLACAFSASYPLALSEGRVHYYYLLKQSIYIILGLGIGLTAYLLPDFLFRLLIPVFMFTTFFVLGLNFLIKSTYVTYEVFFSLILLSVVLYLSLYFANRDNKTSRLRELLFPTFFSVIFVFFITIQQETTYLIIFIAAIIVMFAIGGVGKGGLFLLLLYSIVPSFCWITSNPVRLQTIIERTVPGLNSTEEVIQSILKQQSLTGAGLFGKGLGHGTFKLENLDLISSDFILCNIADELGFAGLAFIIILFGLFAYCGYRCSYYTKRTSYLYSNISAGLTTVIVWQFIINVLIVLEYLPFRGITLPFFSVRTNISILVIDCFLILRCMKNSKKENNKEELNFETAD